MLRRASAQLFQCELLHAPVHEFGDVQGVGVAAVDLIDHAELLELLAGFADAADDRAVQLHLVNFAVQERILGRVGVRAEKILVRAGRDADGARRTDVLDLGLVVAVVVEHLNALIAHVGHVHHALRVNGDGVRSIELAGSGTGPAPGLVVAPGFVELRDAGVAESVGDEDVASSVPGDIGGLVEIIPGRTKARRTTPAAATAAAARASATRSGGTGSASTWSTWCTCAARAATTSTRGTG